MLRTEVEQVCRRDVVLTVISLRFCFTVQPSSVEIPFDIPSLRLYKVLSLSLPIFHSTTDLLHCLRRLSTQAKHRCLDRFQPSLHHPKLSTDGPIQRYSQAALSFSACRIGLPYLRNIEGKCSDARVSSPPPPALLLSLIQAHRKPSFLASRLDASDLCYRPSHC